MQSDGCMVGERGLGALLRQDRKGVTAKGHSADFAERLYKQICGFGKYGFREGHAESFALVVCESAWRMCYHPAVFLASLLNRKNIRRSGGQMPSRR